MPIVIHLGRKSDGCAYELSPASREALKSIPDAHPAKRVFIAFDTASDLERVHGPGRPGCRSVLVRTKAGWRGAAAIDASARSIVPSNVMPA